MSRFFGHGGHLLKDLGSFAPVLSGGALSYEDRVKATQSANLLAYWPLDESSGLVATDVTGHGYNGVISATVVLGVTGIGDGKTAMRFNGVNGTGINIYSAGLAAAVNGNSGTMMIWFKMGSGSLTDGVYRILFYLGENSGSNSIIFDRRTTNNTLRGRRGGQSTFDDVNFTHTVEGTWFHYVAVWSTASDYYKVYRNGVQQGVTQTGLLTWSSQGTGHRIGTYYNNTSAHLGDLAHAAIWTVPLTEPEILALVTP